MEWGQATAPASLSLRCRGDSSSRSLERAIKSPWRRVSSALGGAARLARLPSSSPCPDARLLPLLARSPTPDVSRSPSRASSSSRRSLARKSTKGDESRGGADCVYVCRLLVRQFLGSNSEAASLLWDDHCLHRRQEPIPQVIFSSFHFLSLFHFSRPTHRFLNETTCLRRVDAKVHNSPREISSA